MASMTTYKIIEMHSGGEIDTGKQFAIPTSASDAEIYQELKSLGYPSHKLASLGVPGKDNLTANGDPQLRLIVI